MSGHCTKPTSDNKSKLKELLHKSDNRICADCGTPDPKWASANIGVFICTKCSGVHRSLGSHISKVLSVTLDEWTDEEVECMIEVGGNSYANAIYEAFLPKGYSKPGLNSSTEERTKFIRPKYELQEFLQPSLRIVPTSFKSSFKDSSKEMDGAASVSSMRTEGMVEFIGILNVKVIKGSNLIVKDVQTSDPYVVLILGQQRAQTTVVQSNLNPIWNQELKLSVPQCYGPLKVSCTNGETKPASYTHQVFLFRLSQQQVFDHDTFSADDIMGEAEIDLQPLINSASAFGDPESLENMQIGKWLKTSDNALVHDSTINIVDGKIKQQVLLKLQKVESGDLELELEWFPLDL